MSGSFDRALDCDVRGLGFTFNIQSESFFSFLTYSQLFPSFLNLFLQYSQSNLPPLRPLCEETSG